jgi:hypothetical protein
MKNAMTRINTCLLFLCLPNYIQVDHGPYTLSIGVWISFTYGYWIFIAYQLKGTKFSTKPTGVLIFIIIELKKLKNNKERAFNI